MCRVTLLSGFSFLQEKIVAVAFMRPTGFDFPAHLGVSLPLNEHKQFYPQIDGERDRAPVSGGAKEEYNISPSLPKRGIFGNPSGRISSCRVKT
jgi:hypothetical protein